MLKFMTKIKSKMQLTLIKIRLSKLEIQTARQKRRVNKLVI